MNVFKKTVCMVAVLSTAACGSLSPEKVRNDASKMRDRIATESAIQSSQTPKPFAERMTGSYLGSASIPLQYSASLPSIFRDKQVTLNFPARSIVNGNVNLSTVATRITDVTKIPVRIQPDVFLTAKALLKVKEESSASSPMPMPMAGALLPTPIGQSNRLGANASSSQMLAEYDSNLPMEYSGTLAGFLDFITARLGINWEYRDGGIVLFRLVTKTFVIKVSPGDLKFASSLSKGSSGGASGGGGAAAGGGSAAVSSGAGSFTSDTSSSVTANYSLWTSMASAIAGMKTPVGNVTIDQAAGLVTLTDTKEVIDAASSYINIVNATLTRQIDIEVRVLTVSTNDSESAGLDVNLIYSKINRATSTAPGSLVDTTAGNIGLSVISPASRWAGSSIVAQAMSEVGTVIGDSTKTATTTNRVPVPVATFTTEGYLASTSPASGSLTGSVGLPGLTPGQLTTGSFLNVLPTAFENGSVLLRLAFDDTVSNGMGVISSGNGATFQQIQTPKFTGSKSDHSVGLKDGESLVLLATTVDKTKSNNRTGLSGISQIGERTRETTIIVVTPRVRAGI